MEFEDWKPPFQLMCDAERDPERPYDEAEALYEFVSHVPEFRAYSWVHQDRPDFLGRSETQIIGLEVTQLLEPEARKRNQRQDRLRTQLQRAVDALTAEQDLQSCFAVHQLGRPPSGKEIRQESGDEARWAESVAERIVQAATDLETGNQHLEQDSLLISRIPPDTGLTDAPRILVQKNHFIGSRFDDPAAVSGMVDARVTDKETKTYPCLPDGAELILLVHCREWLADVGVMRGAADALGTIQLETLDRVFLLCDPRPPHEEPPTVELSTTKRSRT